MVAASSPTIPDRHAAGRARQALYFMGIAASVVVSAATFTISLSEIFGRPQPHEDLVFPPAFVFSTGLLFAGSYALHRANRWVRWERQRRFRRWLAAALCLGTMFMGVQTYGLLSLVPEAPSADVASLGVAPMVIAFTGVHAMHFFVATLFVCFIAARTVANRYDHEYHWGVTFCAWFWHALGVAWMAILAVFAIAH